MVSELKDINPVTGEVREVSPTGRYSTMRACRILGMSKEGLRLAAKAGRIRYHLRADNNRRFYKGADIIKFFNSEL